MENKFISNTRDKFPDSRGLVVGSAEQRHRLAIIARFRYKRKKKENCINSDVRTLPLCFFVCCCFAKLAILLLQKKMIGNHNYTHSEPVPRCQKVPILTIPTDRRL